MKGTLNLDYLAFRAANPGKCIGYEQITIGSNVEKLNLTNLKSTPRYAILYLESDATGIAIRYRIDGGIPTTSVGMPKENGDGWDVISTEDLSRLQIIQAQSGNHILNIEYYV